MWRYLISLSIFFFLVTQAQAACVVVDVTGLNVTQRSKLGAAAAMIQADAALAWQDAQGAAVGLQAQATRVNVCAVNTTSITLSALQTNLTTLASAQTTQDSAAAAAATLKVDAGTEIAGNNLCTQASLAAIDTVIDNAAAAIQTDIDATTNIATAKTAMTTMKATMAAAFKKVARCLLAYRQLQ